MHWEHRVNSKNLPVLQRIFTSRLVLHKTNQYGFTTQHEVAQVTDDTEMTVTLMRTLARGYTRLSAIYEYHRYVNSGTYSLGRNTKELLHGYKHPKLYDTSARLAHGTPTSTVFEVGPSV